MKISLAWMARITSALFILLVLLCPALPAAAIARIGQPDLTKIDAFLQDQMRANHLPGLAVGLVHGNQIAQLRGYGEADPSGRAITPQTPFIIGSISKSFTGLATMQLVEAGRITLDAPVQHYLPWFRTSDASATARITVRQLLNQTSGLEDDPSVFLGFSDEQEIQKYLRQVHVDRPVNSSFEYTTINYILLSKIIEIISGQKYADYLQQNVFNPLEMHHSYANVSQARQEGLAQGYLWRFGIPVPSADSLLEIPSYVPGAGLTSTAEDMTHYLIANMNEGRYQGTSVLSPEGIVTMHTPPKLNPASPYGMGWGVKEQDGVTAIAHNGATYTFGAFMLFEPANQWGAIVLTNGNITIAEADLLPPLIQLLAGQEPTETTVSVGTFYLICDLVLALIALIALFLLIRLPWWYGKLAARPYIRWRQVVAPLVWEVLVPVLIVLLIPILMAVSWPLLLLQVPELGSTLLIFCFLWLIAGVTRFILHARLLNRKRMR